MMVRFHHNPIHDWVQEVHSRALDGHLDKIAQEEAIGRKAVGNQVERAEEHTKDRCTTEKKALLLDAHLLGKRSALRALVISPRDMRMHKEDDHRPLMRFTIPRKARAVLFLEEARTKLLQVLLDNRDLPQAMRMVS